MYLYIQAITEALSSGDYTSLQQKCMPLMIIYAGVLIAMGIDLALGIKKSRELGICAKSYGLRRTTKKFLEYFGSLLFAFLIDVIFSNLLTYPWVSTVIGGYLIYTEYRSWREKGDEKIRKQLNSGLGDLATLLENPDTRQAVAQILREKAKEHEDKQGAEKQ